MLCPHGFPEMQCPHCEMGNLQKPEPLVRIAPRELPLDIPVKGHLSQEKTIQEPKIFENTTLSASMPRRLQRSFNLSGDMFNSGSSLFQNRLNQINNGSEKLEKASLVKKQVNIIDIKKKFLE